MASLLSTLVDVQQTLLLHGLTKELALPQQKLIVVNLWQEHKPLT